MPFFASLGPPRDDYFNLNGLPSTTDPTIGTAGTSFDVTLFGYDSRGRPNRVQSPPIGLTSTIHATAYDGEDHVHLLSAVLPNNQVEQTRYNYGFTNAVISSNDLLASVQFPDKVSGLPSTQGGDQEHLAYNALEQARQVDRNGSSHVFAFDVLGRLTSDSVPILGTGVDAAVQRLETAYDTGGRPYLFTSYNNSAGGSGNIVNQVQDGYNGLGQLTVEYQAHGGAVDTRPTSTTLREQYAYSEMSNGSGGYANHSRLVTMTYPNSISSSAARVVTSNYAAGLDDAISRLTSLKDGPVTLEAESYLGLSTVVKRSHPEAQADLTFSAPWAVAQGRPGWHSGYLQGSAESWR